MKRLKRRTIIALVLAARLCRRDGILPGAVAVERGRMGGFLRSQYYNPAPSMTPMASSSTTGRRGVRGKPRHPGGYPPPGGDQNFGTSLRSVLSDRLTGYNPITGHRPGQPRCAPDLDAS